MTAKANVKTEEDWLLDEMKQLATTIHQRCYSHVTQWRVSETPRGVLSQIDNMTAGLLEKLQKTESALGWVLSPFVTDATPEAELRKRIRYANEDWDHLSK